MNKNIIKRIGVTEILGKEIEFYGDWEEPLFIANKVAEWLEERDGSTVARKVDDDEKLIHTICVTGQNRETTMFTEDGLYEALMKSRKEIAKPLKKKIKQYLKQIRKTGGVIEEGREEEFVHKYFPSFSEKVKISICIEKSTSIFYKWVVNSLLALAKNIFLLFYILFKRNYNNFISFMIYYIKRLRKEEFICLKNLLKKFYLVFKSNNLNIYLLMNIKLLENFVF